MTRRLLIVLGLAASACTDHGAPPQASEAEPIVDTPARNEITLAELGWLESLEMPALDEDARVALAATPRECPPARPWEAAPLPYDSIVFGSDFLTTIEGYETIYGQPPKSPALRPEWTDIEDEGCMLEYTNARGEIEWRSFRLELGERWLDRGADGSIDVRRIDMHQNDTHGTQDFATCDELVFAVVRPPEFERERGFRTMLALSDQGDLRVTPLRGALFWQLGRRSGYERYEHSTNDKPLRVDGFDGAGVWRRSSLFSYDREYVVRHDFEVVEGEAKLVATLVLDRDSQKVELARSPERIEYRRHVERSGAWRAELVAGPEGVSRHGFFKGHEHIAQHGVVPVDIVRTADETRRQLYGVGLFVERCDVEPPPRPDWMADCL